MRTLIYSILLFLLLSACSTKKYIYINEENKTLADSTFYETKKNNYQLQPGDILYISIHSTLSETKGIFHFPGQENLTFSAGNEGNMYLNQSVISAKGYIRIPVIGNIYVAGSTVENIEEIIQKEAQKYISDALARVKLVSFEISFIGEFNNVGKYTFYKDRINILDALAAAGEVTFYGNRENIRIIRQTPKGVYTYSIDLTDKNLMTSDKFYLQPNDIVYAEPLARRIFKNNASDYSTIVATLASTLALFSLIFSLKD